MPLSTPLEPGSERRRYDSPLRRQRSEETRQRIVNAGAELAHGLPAWDWRGLTFRAVGERATVSERTVHRYFTTERQLREAVLQRLIEEANVPLDGLSVATMADMASRTFAYLASFAIAPPPQEPAFVALEKQRRDALLDAVTRETEGWQPQQRRIAAAVLDVLWNVPTYERLSAVWGLDGGEVTQATHWVIGLIEQAIREGRKP